MKKPRTFFPWRFIVPLALAMVLGFVRLSWGQGGTPAGASSGQNASGNHGGVPSDWSHHHLSFSPPGTMEEALRDGTYDRWLTITNDPRYELQQRKRGGVGSAPPFGPPSVLGVEDQGCGNDRSYAGEHVSEDKLPLGLFRALIPPPQSSDKGKEPAEGGDCWRSSGKSNRFQRDWSEDLGNNGTTGLGNYPATFTSTSASCTSDFAVYNTGLAGSSSQASIVAYNELYSGCSSRPSVYWAFDTGGTISNSAVLSLDGTQVAFVQSNSGVASLVIVKWASQGTVSSPKTLTSNSSYPNCTAPCMISLTLSGSPNDSFSSPYLVYGLNSNTVFVGDDSGSLHQFINIFSAGVTPSEVTTSPWPVTVNNQASLASPVFDPVSGNIFVGDYLANAESGCQPGIDSAEGACGFLYSVNIVTGSVVRSAQLDFNLGIYDGPLVDSSAGEVYAFIGADDSTNCSGNPCAAVYQLPVNFISGAAGTEATIGAGYEFVMSGTFDNQYFTSASASSPTGHLYVVGGTGAENNTLYAVSITGNVMASGAATAGPVLATNYTDDLYGAGLPVTEFCNNGSSPCTATQGTDYIFLGVLAYGSNFATNPCTSQSATVGCVMGFTAPASGVIASSATPNGSLAEAGGVSGIVIDNGAAGASNIYFSTLLNQCGTGGTGGCAVSATQSGLQ